jgi:hypothetical protein
VEGWRVWREESVVGGGGTVDMCLICIPNAHVTTTLVYPDLAFTFTGHGHLPRVLPEF